MDKKQREKLENDPDYLNAKYEAEDDAKDHPIYGQIIRSLEDISFDVEYIRKTLIFIAFVVGFIGVKLLGWF